MAAATSLWEPDVAYPYELAANATAASESPVLELQWPVTTLAGKPSVGHPRIYLATVKQMMNVPPLTPGQRIPVAEKREISAALLRRYNEGSSIREISAATGYPAGRVRRLLIHAGATFRPRGGAHPPKSNK